MTDRRGSELFEGKRGQPLPAAALAELELTASLVQTMNAGSILSEALSPDSLSVSHCGLKIKR